MASDPKAAKRHHGEGQIEQLPSGRFRAALPGRKRAGGSKTFPTRKEAVAWLQANANKPRGDSAALRVWAEQWYAVHKTQTAVTNHARDRQILDRHILPRLGNTPVRGLTATVVNEWLAALHAAKVSSYERRRAAVTLRKCLRANELFDRSIFQRVKIPRHKAAETRHLTPAELRVLVQTAVSWDGDYLAMVLVGIDCATRAGELLALQWGDFDREKGTLSLRRAVCTRSAALKDMKTERSRRTVPLTTSTIAALTAMKAGGLTDPIFCSSHRGRLAYWTYPDWLRYRWWPLVKAAGLAGTGVTPKSLRHTAATLLLASGTNIVTVSRRLGHSTVTQTLNTYGHSMPNDQSAADTLVKFFA